MKFSIPQYISAEIEYDENYYENMYKYPRPKRRVDVYIGGMVVFTAEVDGNIEDDDDAKMDAVTQFGQMLKLKIGD